MRSLQDRTAFIINIYQHNKFLQSVISIPKQCNIHTSSWNSFGIYLGGWAGDYNIQITNCCCITTCNECSINRVHLTFSLYANCQNRPCGKGINTTAFVFFAYLLCLCKHFTVKKLSIVFTKLFSQSDSTSIQIKYCIIKRISHYPTDPPGQQPLDNIAYWAPTMMSVPQKANKIKCSRQ